ETKKDTKKKKTTKEPDRSKRVVATSDDSEANIITGRRTRPRKDYNYSETNTKGLGIKPRKEKRKSQNVLEARGEAIPAPKKRVKREKKTKDEKKKEEK